MADIVTRKAARQRVTRDGRRRRAHRLTAGKKPKLHTDRPVRFTRALERSFAMKGEALKAWRGWAETRRRRVFLRQPGVA